MEKLNLKKATIKDKLILVEGTCIQALQRKLNKNSKTGYKGIFLQENGKYRASIGFQHKTINLGVFLTLTEARRAREEAERYYFEPVLRKHRKEEDNATGRV